MNGTRHGCIAYDRARASRSATSFLPPRFGPYACVCVCVDDGGAERHTPPPPVCVHFPICLSLALSPQPQLTGWLAAFFVSIFHVLLNSKMHPAMRTMDTHTLPKVSRSKPNGMESRTGWAVKRETIQIELPETHFKTKKNGFNVMGLPSKEPVFRLLLDTVSGANTHLDNRARRAKPR